MATDGGCSLCGADDSWRHALLECYLARCGVGPRKGGDYRVLMPSAMLGRLGLACRGDAIA